MIYVRNRIEAEKIIIVKTVAVENESITEEAFRTFQHIGFPRTLNQYLSA